MRLQDEYGKGRGIIILCVCNAICDMCDFGPVQVQGEWTIKYVLIPTYILRRNLFPPCSCCA